MVAPGPRTGIGHDTMLVLHPFVLGLWVIQVDISGLCCGEEATRSMLTRKLVLQYRYNIYVLLTVT